MKTLRTILCGIAIWALAAPVAWPAAGERHPAPGRGGADRDAGGASVDRTKGADQSSSATNEIEEFEKFMQQHSGRRFGVWLKTHSGRPNKANVGPMIESFRKLRSMQHDDPDLYRLKVSQIETEDQVWALRTELLASPNSPGAAALKEQLRNKVAELIDQRQAEREHRITRARRALEQAETQAQFFKRNRADIIEKRFHREIEGGAAGESTPGHGAPNSPLDGDSMP